MADSYTGNINLRKPEVGHANDTWGGVAGLNADLDLLDAIFLYTGLSTVAPPAGHPLAAVPGVGLRIGKGMVLNVEGQVQVKDPTDVTKVGTLSSDLIPTATTVNLKFPPDPGTIATKEVLVATVSASHPAGTILSGYYGATPPSGYIFVDGRTIGDATSAATNRANADCQRLFLQLWGVGMAVVGGRGATAAADWAAHKQLVLPNHSGRTMAGRDNLSGTAAGILNGFTAVGVAGGAQTGATGNIHSTGVNNINFGNVGFQFTGGSGTVNGTTNIANGTGGTVTLVGPGESLNINSITGYTPINNNFSIAVDGSSAAFNIVQPSIAVDVVMAL